jgi:regulation of enolase protein 1 (concanavalin A-like superfamily)
LKVYNSDGKQLSVRGKGNNERLVDHSDRIIAIEDGHWFRLFYNFKQISVSGKTPEYDVIIGVAGETVTIQEGHWIRTYDKKFKLINTRS